MPGKKAEEAILSLPDFRIPKVGFGTWQLYGNDATDAVLDALEVGYRHIDTARAYENETHIGKAISESGVKRDALFITDKILPLGRRSETFSANSVRWAVDESLHRLDTDYLDLLLLHWPIPSAPLQEILPAMARLVDEGWVKNIGVSNFPAKLLESAVEFAPIACNQIEYHPFLSQDTVLNVAAKHDIVVTAHTPLAAGRVFGDETLRRIALEHGKTVAQVCLRWLTGQPNVATVSMAPTPEWRLENLQVFDFELTTQNTIDINALACNFRVVNPPFAPDWSL